MTTQAATAPRPARSVLPPQSSAKRISLADIKRKGRGIPPAIGLQGPPSIGKTSFGAAAPKAIFIETRGETGLETLMDAGRVRETPFWLIESWSDLLSAIESLINDEHDFKTVVFDTIGGAERLMHEHECAVTYKNDWTDKGFMGYMRGYETSLAHWRVFLNLLDELREKRGMCVIFLAHTKIRNFKNPEGTDYDRYEPEMHHKTWALTNGWLDILLFANFYAVVEEVNARAKKGKATGGQERLMYTERTAAYDAKNRHGLPAIIEMGSSGVEAWGNFVAAMREAKKAGIQPVVKTDQKENESDVQ